MDEVIKGIREMKADWVRSFIIEENGEYFELIIKKVGDHIYPKYNDR